MATMSRSEEEFVNVLLTPTYAHSIRKKTGLVETAGRIVRLVESPSNQTESLSALPQLDAAADFSALPHLPPKPSPLSQSILQGPASLLASRHAPRADELPSSPRRRPSQNAQLTALPETPGSLISSDDSVTSRGEWRHPPTRFQRLAAFIEVGDSLNEVEQSAVELWKAVSEEQLAWEGFLAKSEQLRREFEDALIDDEVPAKGVRQSLLSKYDESKDEAQLQEGDVVEESGIIEESELVEVDERTRGSILSNGRKAAQQEPGAAAQDKGKVEDEVGSNEQVWMTKALLSKKQCRGKNLSAILADIRSR